jgi:UDP-glucose 4-epimerase
MKETITVFGGAGFLGSHVCDKLSDAGYRVKIFDIKESEYLRPSQKMILGDITDEKAVRDAVAGSSYVFNFAGIADIDEAKSKPLETVRNNILGNTVILEGCRRESIKRIVFASSVYVYSQSGAFYRASKQACENYIEVYQDLYDLKYTILRFGTLYGPRSDKRNAIYRFIEEAIVMGKITYDGDVNARREYIHVEDAAIACIEILKSEYENQHIVLTGSQVFMVRDLLEMIAEIVPEDIQITYQRVNNKTAHYILTPHEFSPKIGRKLIPPLQIDLGQGLLKEVEEIYLKNHPGLRDNKDGLFLLK